MSGASRVSAEQKDLLGFIGDGKKTSEFVEKFGEPKGQSNWKSRVNRLCARGYIAYSSTDDSYRNTEAGNSKLVEPTPEAE